MWHTPPWSTWRICIPDKFIQEQGRNGSNILRNRVTISCRTCKFQEMIWSEMALLRRDTLADTGFTTKRGAHMMHGCGARKLRKLVRSGFGAGSASQPVMLFFVVSRFRGQERNRERRYTGGFGCWMSVVRMQIQSMRSLFGRNAGRIPCWCCGRMRRIEDARSRGRHSKKRDISGSLETVLGNGRIIFVRPAYNRI